MTPASDDDPRLSEFLGLNLDVFQELVTLAAIAEGFTLAIVESNFSSDGDLLVQALHRHAVAQTVQLIECDFSDQASFSLVAALQAKLATMTLDSASPPVLLVRGLATAIGVKGDYPNFLNDLNYRRDQLARTVPYPLVLFLPNYAVTRLGQYARDLWTWKSALFHFRTTQHTLESTQTQLRQPHPTLPADSKPAKQDRIERLERLLSEQLNTSDPPPHATPDCTAMALELGDAYRSLTDYAQAQRYYRKALDWAETTHTQDQQAEALYGLGQVHRLQVDNQRAMAHFDQALATFRATGARLGEANTLQAIGDVEQFLKRSQDALQHYDQALELYQATGARLGEANTLQAIGKLELQLNPQNALRLFQQAQSLYEAIGDCYSQCLNLQLLMRAQLTVGDRSAALQTFNQFGELIMAEELSEFRNMIFRQMGQRLFKFLLWGLVGFGIVLLLWWIF